MPARPGHPSLAARRRLASPVVLAAILAASYAVAGPPQDTAMAYDPGGPAAAVQALQRQAAQGVAAAELRLGMMYAAGQGVDQDNRLAAQWLAMAAHQGDVGARTMLIGLCASPQASPLAPCAPLVGDITTSAARGDPQAQLELGSFYLAGAAGLPRDPATAVGWYRKAADQGYTRAEFQLGLVYGGGMGVDADPGQATGWFRKAADQGDVTSIRTLAMAYQAGLYGIAKDPSEAAAWYLKAAHAGDANAQFALAGLYADGAGVAADPVQAVQWYRKAAEQGDASAAAALASAYAAGMGALQDDVQAYVWMDVAITKTEQMPGGARSYWLAARDLIGGRLNPAQLADAKSRSAAFMARHGPQ